MNASLHHTGRVTILVGDVREWLAELPDESFDCVVTSPPYWGLRDYGVAGQIGLEPTLTEYLDTMVAVCRELRRVLKPSGTFWLNVGDSYNAHHGQRKTTDKVVDKQLTNAGSNSAPSRYTPGLKPKDLCMVPNRLAIRLQEDGWYVRSEIIWHKPSCMPESVTDRPTNTHEKIWLLTKSEQYCYDADAIREPTASLDPEHESFRPNSVQIAENGRKEFSAKNKSSMRAYNLAGRNARNVWTIASQPYSEAHFATFPPELAERCIKAGTSEKGCCPHCGNPWSRLTEKFVDLVSGSGRSGRKPTGKRAGGAQIESGSYDIRMGPSVSTKTVGWEPSCDCPAHNPIPCHVLDPFGGAGTTSLVAHRLHRSCTLIELNPDYVEIARNRLADDGGMFASVSVNLAGVA